MFRSTASSAGAAESAAGTGFALEDRATRGTEAGGPQAAELRSGGVERSETSEGVKTRPAPLSVDGRGLFLEIQDAVP